jgi:hypothetical protein
MSMEAGTHSSVWALDAPSMRLQGQSCVKLRTVHVRG